jgi:hypothetical protein
MREVRVPTGLLPTEHPCRRPIVLIAAWLVVLQAFLAGVATARAGAILASDPAAICHGSGGAGPVDSTAPETAKLQHLCCAYCTVAAPAAAPPDALVISRARQASRPVAYCGFTILLSRGVIRAGSARAPPTLA